MTCILLLSFCTTMAIMVILTTPSLGPKPVDEVLKTEIHRFEAMTQNDWEVLDEVLAKDVMYIHCNAKVDTKA